MKVKLQIGTGDWAQVIVGDAIVYRGHEDETKDVALMLAGVEVSHEIVDGARVDDVRSFVEALAKSVREEAEKVPLPDGPTRMWINAMGIVIPSDAMLMEIGQMVVQHLKESMGRPRGPLDPIMQANLLVSAS